MGRARVSTTAWSFVENPPRECPIALASIPLSRPTHPGARGPPSHPRWSRRHPAPARHSAVSPSDRGAPTAQTGCTPISKAQSVEGGPATATLLLHETGPPRQRRGHPATTSDPAWAAGSRVPASTTAHRSERVFPSSRWITSGQRDSTLPQTNPQLRGMIRLPGRQN
jgi:hypothetical protein